MTDVVVREVRTTAPVHVMWAALTDPARVGQWLGDSAEIDLRPGGLLRFTWPAGEIATGRVVAVDPMRCFAFRWDVFGTVHNPDLYTSVEFRLEDRESGLRVRVTESGLAALVDAGIAPSLTDLLMEHEDGWRNELSDLVRYAEAQPVRPAEVRLPDAGSLPRPIPRPAVPS